MVFLPTHTCSNPCTGKVFTVEMHHQPVDFANPGDNLGLNYKTGDVEHLQNFIKFPDLSQGGARRTPPWDRSGNLMQLVSCERKDADDKGGKKK